ncbi:MAG TPA: hypothetical protein VN829_08055 [Dongiaceae bacterium]|nr:hypothetical protein [Dongiaceae bacterium]
MTNSPPVCAKTVVCLVQFLGGVALAAQATAQTPPELGLPRGIMTSGQSSQMARQLQTLIVREDFNRAFQFNHAHIYP